MIKNVNFRLLRIIIFLLLIIIIGTLYFTNKTRDLEEELGKAKKEVENLTEKVEDWEQRFLENQEKKKRLEEKYVEKNG